MEYMELLIVGTPPHLSDMDEEEVMQQDGDPEQPRCFTVESNMSKLWDIVE